MNREEIIERVKKVLALTGSPNEAEAALAAIKAREILDKYDLDMKDIAGSEFEDVLEPATLEFGSPEEKKVWVFLANAIGKYQNCKLWYDTQKTTHIVGHTSDLELFEYTYKYLRHAIEMLAEKHEFLSWRERKSYYMGAISNVRGRLLSSREEVIRAQDARALMVLNKQDFVDDWIVKNLGKLKAGSSSKIKMDSENYYKGERDANSITLRNGIRTDGNGEEGLRIGR